MEKKLTSLVLVLACPIVCAGAEVQMEIEWIQCEDPPPMGWTIEPANPTTNDVIRFSGYTGCFDNEICAEQDTANRTIKIDYSSGLVLLEFHPERDGCYVYFWAPIYAYIQGSFGPLSEGDWRFYVGGSPSRVDHGGVKFHVSPLSLVAPDGGEFLESDSTATIAWSDSRSGPEYAANYLLEYSSDDGATWSSIGSGPVSSTCSYEWLVPTIESDECLVRVTDADGASVSDTSNDVFSIGACACMGDMNHDGWVSPADISAVVGLLLNSCHGGLQCPWWYYDPPPCGEVNGDGWLSPSDISAMVTVLLPHKSSAYWLECD